MTTLKRIGITSWRSSWSWQQVPRLKPAHKWCRHSLGESSAPPPFAYAQSTTHPKVGAPDLTKRTMASLVGRPVYDCLIDRNSTSLLTIHPDIFEGTDKLGRPIPGDTTNWQTGDKLLIRAAKAEVVLFNGDPKQPYVSVSLTVENQVQKTSASVKLNVDVSDVTPGRIMAALTGESPPVFSAHPLSGDIENRNVG
jgi:hypothetical protein